MPATAAAEQAPSMVTRMTAILDVFDSSHGRRSLQEVASLTGLPRSTAHRILDQLVQLGWVEHNVGGYCLGWRANHLPTRAEEDARLREVAVPYLHELAVRTNLTVHLAVLDGPFVRCLDKIGGQTALALPSRVGGLFTAHLSAVGKAMLACIDPEAVDVMLEQFDSYTDSTVLSPATLHRELALVRTRGLATCSLAAVSFVGVPLFDHEQRNVGGISLCDEGSGTPLDRFVPLLVDRAKRISAQLSSRTHPNTSASPRRAGGISRGLGMPATPIGR